MSERRLDVSDGELASAQDSGRGASSFDFDMSTRQRLGYLTINKLNEYFASLGQRAVQPPQEQRNFKYMEQPIPENGEDAELVLEEVFEKLCERGFHITSANYLGLMNPTPTFVSVLAETIVAGLNPQLASAERSASASLIEKQTVHWVAQLIWSQGKQGGVFTTGASEATSSALNLALARLSPAIITQGLRVLDASAVFYASREAHHSLEKCAGIVGLGRQALRRIQVTDRMQMDLTKLEAQICTDLQRGVIPFCVVGTAGTTNSGAIDDLAGAAEIARKYGVWFHVDAAYGGAVLFSERHRKLLQGIEQADSVALDPHKWLAMPFSAGMFLTRHPELLREMYGTTPPYLRQSFYEGIEDNFEMSSQWSRRMNSLKLWMTLRIHGRRSYETMITNQLELATETAQWIERSRFFELCAPQGLTAITFRVKLDGATETEIATANAAVVNEVNFSGQRWISLTTVAGRSAIRIMVISYLTRQSHLQALSQALEEAVARTLDARRHGSGAVTA